MVSGTAWRIRKQQNSAKEDVSTKDIAQAIVKAAIERGSKENK